MAFKTEDGALRGGGVWRQLIQVEGPGIRTAIAVVLPLIIGQASGHPLDGIIVGLGGLYTSLADRTSPPVTALLAATALTSISAFIGTLAGNSTWVATLLMFCVAFIGAITVLCSETAGQVGFIFTLVLAISIGLPGDIGAAVLRLGEFFVGGPLAALLTLILRRIEAVSQPAASEDAAPPRPDRRTTIWHALHIAFAAALAIALAKLLRLEHGSWLALTVLVIVKPDYPGTQQRAIERVGGSLLGGAIALILAAIVRSVVVIDLLLVGLSVLAFSQLRRNYPLFVVYLTPFVVLMLNMLKPGNWQIALLRIEETLAGGALAIATALLFHTMDSRNTRDSTNEGALERREG